MSDTLQLLIAARQGDENARKKVIEENTRLVWSVARRFQNRGQELEDLFQIGCIGLVKAIDNFDVTRP
ncbi:MAG: sigma-70 family RNA polymerase sigma factor, partial [Lachnospiraceae bacterium]|nr:sigma-70 family RNA polymerase sigma factor [Lachnospiraceae bacterium]